MNLKGGFALTLPLCLVFAFGCQNGNPNTPASVKGKVTYKGEPVPGGRVTFVPKAEGVAPTAILGADGTYSIADAPAGDFTVTVDNEFLNPDKKAPAYPGSAQAGNNPMGSGPPPGAPAAAAAPTGKYVKIPKKYADAKESTLTAKLAAGTQTQDFKLED